MKTKSYLIGLLLLMAGLFTFSTHQTPAQGGPNREPHAVVILGDIEAGVQTPERFIQTGMQVDWADCSPTAPQIQKGANLSATIAYLMDQGFAHEMIGTRKHLFKR